MNDCNCKQKKYEISLGCCVPVVAPADNYYTKYQIDQMLSGQTSGCCITPEEVDEKIEEAISGITPCDLSEYWTSAQTESAITSAITVVEGKIPSLSGYATEQWVEDKHYLTEHQPLKTINGYTISGTGNIEITASGGSISVDSELSLVSTNPVENKVITEALNDKLDASAYTPCDLSDYWTSAQTQSAITEATSGCSGCTVDQSLDSGSTNAISNAVVTNTFNNYMLKSNIWCGSEADWALISGNTDVNTIYLIHE